MGRKTQRHGDGILEFRCAHVSNKIYSIQLPSSSMRPDWFGIRSAIALWPEAVSILSLSTFATGLAWWLYPLLFLIGCLS